jgi:Cu(I)/Ag(I) efflux system membrane fusion protein
MTPRSGRFVFVLAVLGAGCTSTPTDSAAHEHGVGATTTETTTPPTPHEHGSVDAAPGSHASGAIPPGYSAIALSDDTASRLNLTRATVEERDFKRTLRTVGAVTVDETRSSHVHPKVRGWIDQIDVNFTGRTVRQGARLCSLYSPEVLSAELEFLAILNQNAPAARAAGGEFADVEKRARTVTLEAARRRLTLWDVPPSEIERLEQTREPQRAFPLMAPRGGTVVAKQAIAGMYVDASTELYLISDLSKVWVLVDVYEADLPYVKVGARARLSIEGAGPTPLEAPIVFLAPTIDEPTRTLKARFELDNRDRKLRPGAFVTAEMDIDAGRGLGVPEDAVLRTGSRNIVFVILQQRIEPREVTLGPLVGGWYQVASGLHTGEQVATGAQFLLDSESRIRATSAPGGAHAH